MPKRPPGDPIPPRSSGHPDRRSLHLNLTAREYALLTERAEIAGLSRPRYAREATLAFQLYRTTSPAELLAHTTHAIACVRELARMTATSQNLYTWRRLEVAMAELLAKDAELERHVQQIARALALRPPDAPPPTSERRLPGPGATIWRPPSHDQSAPD
jgi:hypothetical protein